MQKRTYPSTSIWIGTGKEVEYKTLKKDIEVDIAIVGAGIAGLTTAYFLVKAGKKVWVFEKDSLNSGQTARTTAHLTNAFDDRYYNMENIHGKEQSRLIAESHTEAIAIVERICKAENINCDFHRVPGYLIGGNQNDDKIIMKEYEAATSAGIPGIRKLDQIPQMDFLTWSVLLFPEQGAIHALKYLRGLAEAFIENGGLLFMQAHVESVSDEESPSITLRDKNTIRAKKIVLATNSPINRNALVHTKQVPYRSYVIGMSVPRGSIPDILLWDTLDPYHYVRLLRSETNPEIGVDDILIVGGEDHLTGEEIDGEGIYDRLEIWTQERFPSVIKRVYAWSGQVMEPYDGIALIGKSPGSENIYIITWDSGNGMTHWTLWGKLIADLILEKVNPWEDLYDPSRIRLKAIGEYIKDSVDMVNHYGKWLTPWDLEKKQIPKDSWGIIRDGVKKIAIYRDKEWNFHKCSAICPHLGCIVAWNDAEKSFDCPCHWSSFDRYGKVMNGPSTGDLEGIDK